VTGSGDVTVVVASRNRRAELLASIPRHEAPVVLVDNASGDGSAEAVRSAYPDVTVLPLPENLGAQARTLGVAEAGTPFVAFADDDSWWARGDLARAVAILRAHPRLALLNARVLVGPEERLDPVCAEMASSALGTEPDLPGPSILGFIACAALVRTEAFEAAGGFDAVIRFPGEEERLALDLAAAGWGLAYVEDVVAHHHPSPVRNTVARRARADRNRLLTAVMRRPWPVVLAEVRRDLTRGPAGRMAVLEALRVAPRAVARRRRLPPEVEQARRPLG
jgi:GT2 family glycosyltransferase